MVNVTNNNVWYGLEDGDQIQLFYAKRHPQTGEERQLMVIWRDNTVVWSGPPDQSLINDSRYPTRDILIQLPVHMIKNFHIEKETDR